MLLWTSEYSVIFHLSLFAQMNSISIKHNSKVQRVIMPAAVGQGHYKMMAGHAGVCLRVGFDVY